MRRVLKKILVIALIGSTILVITAFVLARMFEDELTQYVVEGLNRQVRTEVKIESVNLSFIKKFPDASLEFQDVFIASVPDYVRSVFGDTNTDTLLVAEQLFLRFNVLKLLKRQYIIREVHVQTGKLNLFVDEAGNGNYIFWEKKEGDREKNFLLALDNVRLSNILFRFDNRALEINIRGMVRKSYFKGQFSRESYSMSAGLEGMLHNYSNKGTVFLKEQKISSAASMFIDPQSIEITDGNVNLAGQQMLVSGTMLRPKPLELDLNLTGKNLDLEQILKHILTHSEKYPEDLKAGGELDFNGSIKGVVSNTKIPGIEAEFTLKNGWMESSKIPGRVHDIKTGGSYSNGKLHEPRTTTIRLSDVSMRYGNSRLGGDYSVSNLVSPQFNYKIKTDLDLSDIQGFVTADTMFENLSGRVLAEIQMQGNQGLLENLGRSDLLKYKYKANVRLEDVGVQFKKTPLVFNNFTGDAVFTDHLNIKSLSGKLENSQVSISGRVDNFLEFLFTPGGNLWMDIDLYSERMDLNHMRSLNLKSRQGRTADTILLPGRLFLKTRFWFDEIEIKNFQAKDVTGNLIYQPGRLSINHVELMSMEGRIISEGILEQQKDYNFFVRSMSTLNSVDMTRAFSSFNNFGQEFILDRNLKGSLSGTVNFSTGLNEKMKIKKKTILADCDIIIKNGELSDFDPMMKLSRFIDVEELESIQFSTLTNEIFIRNEEILIPKMDIHSSAFDITASGIHGFDKNFTYKARVSMSELLAKKSRKPDKTDSEFGVIEDDGLGRMYVYLIIEGSPQGTDVKYDRRGAVQNIREQMNEEKQELKQIFKEEFGLFKNDSTLKDEAGEGNSPAFIIDWEEDGDSVGERQAERDNNSEKERFIIEWDEDESDPVEKEPEKKKKRKKKKL